MVSIFEAAWNGTLKAEDLVGKATEINEVRQREKLTPLGAAVWKGSKKQVKLLLKYGANVNGGPGARPPLWVAAARTENHVSSIIEILLKNKADPNLPSIIDGGTTPLQRLVKRRRGGTDLGGIKALVDAGASPTAHGPKNKSAQQIADDSHDPDVLHALRPRQQRTKRRVEHLLVLSGLMLFIVAWANKNYKAAAAVAVASVVVATTNIVSPIKKLYNMSGSFNLKVPEKLQKEENKKVFKKDMHDYIQQTNLDKFFKNDTFLDEVVKKAVDLEDDPKNTLDVQDLTRLALYQPVLYCDDSGSMTQDHRFEIQADLAERITSITTRLVPDNEGIELRLINKDVDPSMSKPSAEAVNQILKAVPYNGWTEIGVNFKKKILEKMVYEPLKSKTFNRPLLISILTDGTPYGPAGSRETRDTLKNAMIECGNILEQNKFDRKVVRFHISQIGSDDGAETFIKSLASDPDLSSSGVLYCTAQSLDEEFNEFRDNEARLEQWLLDLLMQPIMNRSPG